MREQVLITNNPDTHFLRSLDSLNQEHMKHTVKPFASLLIASGILLCSCGGQDQSSKDAGETKLHTVPDSALPATTQPQPAPVPASGQPPLGTADEEALIQGLAPITRDYPNVFVEVVNGGIILKGQVEKMRHPLLIQSIKALRPKNIDESQLVVK